MVTPEPESQRQPELEGPHHISDTLDRLAFSAGERHAHTTAGREGAQLVIKNSPEQAQVREAAELARAGDLEEAQRALEAIKIPDSWARDAELTEQRRDAQAQLHRQITGEPTPQSLMEANEYLPITISEDMTALRQHGRKPNPDQLEALRNLGQWRRNTGNYFSDEVKEEGEPTGHERAEQAFSDILTYIEDKLAHPYRLTEQRLEALRVARDRIHQDHATQRSLYGKQTHMAERFAGIVGRDHPDFNLGAIQGQLRGMDDDRLYYYGTVLDMALRAQDPYERMDLMRDLQHGRIPLDSQEDFWRWQAERQKGTQRRHARQRTVDIESARRKIAEL